MIEAFENANPSIKIKVVVDPSGANGIRAARTKSDSPDVIRVTNFQQPEFAATGSILPIDDLVARDKFDANDWLIPLEQTKVNGKLWGLQQDYRVPILVYRKSRFAEAQVTTPPRTYDEVGALGAKLTKGNNIAYAIPIGVAGGIGGAQAFVEFILSSILAGNTGAFFAPDGRNIGFSDERLLLAATTIRDLFGKYKASTPVTLQFGYNELQDALRAGIVASASFGLYRYKGHGAPGRQQRFSMGGGAVGGAGRQAHRLWFPAQHQCEFASQGRRLGVRQIHGQPGCANNRRARRRSRRPGKRLQ